jgi:hypothetical protein
LHPFFKRSSAAVDIILYLGIFFPLGIACNYFNTGRYLRGSFTMTLWIALIMRTVEAVLPSP